MNKQTSSRPVDNIEAKFIRACASEKDRETGDAYVKDYTWSPLAQKFGGGIAKDRMEALLTADAFAFRVMQCLDALATSNDVGFYSGLRYNDRIWRWELCLPERPKDKLIRNALDAHAGARPKNLALLLRPLCDCAYDECGSLRPPSKFLRELKKSRPHGASSTPFAAIILGVEKMKSRAGRPEGTGSVPAMLVREVYERFCERDEPKKALALLNSKEFIEYVYNAAEFYGFSICPRFTEKVIRNFRSDENRRLKLE